MRIMMTINPLVSGVMPPNHIENLYGLIFSTSDCFLSFYVSNFLIGKSISGDIYI